MRSMTKYPLRRARRVRRGHLYISVMAVTAIVSMIVLSSMHMARMQLKSAASSKDRYMASLLANSAIEHCITEIQRTSNWRSTFALDTEYPSPPVKVQNGTFSWKITKITGSQYRLVGIGRIGRARSTCTVNIVKSGDNYLQRGLLSGGNVNVGVGTTTETLRVDKSALCTNATLNNLGAITANVEAQTINNSGTITGTQTAPAPVQPLPDPVGVFDYYISKGTTLATTNLQDVLLSPNSNPFGSTNAQGIYVINANGGSVKLKRVRLVATLIVLNAPGGISIDDDICWEPAYPNYPALLIQGPIYIRMHDGKVREVDAGTNLNPVGTPYQGVTDSAIDDEYPSRLAGIIYTTGNLHIDGKNANFSPKIQGVVIAGGTVTLEKTAKPVIDYQNLFASNPPPGFGTPAVTAIVPGTWRQIVSN